MGHPGRAFLVRHASIVTLTVLLLVAATAHPVAPSSPIPRLLEQLQKGDLLARQEAAEALGDLGPAAEEALPALRAGMKEELLCRSAARAAARMGRPGVAVLIEAGSRDEGVHLAEVEQALASVGAPAVPELIEALRHPNEQRRRALAVGALGRIGRAAEAAIPALRGVLLDRRLSPRLHLQAKHWELPCVERTHLPVAEMDDDFLWLRREAADALSRIGPAAAPALIRIVQGRGGLHRMGTPAALLALPRLARKMKDQKETFTLSGWIVLLAQTPKLLDSAWEYDATARRLAALALGRMRPTAPDAVPALIAALHDTDESVQDAAAAGLREMGPAARAAVPALIEEFERAPPSRWRSLVFDLTELGPAADDALVRRVVPRLLEQARCERKRSDLDQLAECFGFLGARARAKPETIEALVQLLLAENRSKELATALAAIHPEPVALLVRLLSDRSAMTRSWAAMQLAQRGPTAQSAVPGLKHLLANDLDLRVRQAALDALNAILDETTLTPLLIAALNDDALMDTSAGLLGPLGPDARAALPALRRRMTSKSSPQAVAAVRAMIEIEGPTQPALDRLAALLLNPESTASEQAHAAARALGRKARALAPLLRRSLHKLDDVNEESERIAVAWTLARIDPGCSDATAILAAAVLTDKRREALRALYALGPRAAAAAPDVTALLQTQDLERTYSALVAGVLGRMGPTAAGSALTLEGVALGLLTPREVLSGGHVLMSSYDATEVAIESLGLIGARTESSVRTLTALLQHPNVNRRYEAARALGRIGPAAKRAVPRLEALREEGGNSALWAAFALARITGRVKEQAEWLVRAARTDDEAAVALGELGAAAEPILPTLLAAATGADEAERNAACKILERLGPAVGRSATPRLMRLLDDRRPEVRTAAARALASMGPSARAALLLLRERARDDVAASALAATTALRRLRPIAPSEPSPPEGMVVDRLGYHLHLRMMIGD
jgi:HEAT repeat protein